MTATTCTARLLCPGVTSPTPDARPPRLKLTRATYLRRRIAVASVGLVLLGALGITAVQLARDDSGSADTTETANTDPTTTLDAVGGTTSDGTTSATAGGTTSDGTTSDGTTSDGTTDGSSATAVSTSSAADTAGSAAASTMPITTSVTTTLVGAEPPPDVDAIAYAVYDPATETWMAEQGADERRPVGSIMKLLTARVVLDTGDLTKVVTVPQLALDPQESAIGLLPGEQYGRDVLFRAMLIVSANDAARSLAVDIAGDESGFVDMMNQTAERMGLVNTNAANPVGLDASTGYSSARDMVLLANDLLGDPTFAAAVLKPTAKLHGQTFPSTNDLLGTYPGADGVKTGRTTQAGYCLIGSATRDGRRVIVAVLGSSTDAARAEAASDLLDWAFATEI